MNEAETFATWDLLKDLGFQPDDECPTSKWGTSLSFDFGNFQLFASCVMTMRLAEVVAFDGVWVTPRIVGRVSFEMPRRIASRELCAAWIVWSLDRQATDRNFFQPAHNPDWVVEGRQHRHLLPWEVEIAAYNARPYCLVERAWLRLALKNLAKLFANADDAAPVEFSFDGSVLLIRCFGQVVAMSASGKAWATQFVLPVGKIRRLPKRLMQDEIEVAVHQGRLHIGPSSFEGAKEKLP